jgi:hypothetical protein
MIHMLTMSIIEKTNVFGIYNRSFSFHAKIMIYQIEINQLKN